MTRAREVARRWKHNARTRAQRCQMCNARFGVACLGCGFVVCRRCAELEGEFCPCAAMEATP